MRIDSMDATNITISRVGNPTGGKEPVNDGNKANTSINTETNDKISEKVVSEAIDKANKVISSSNRRFEYSVHKRTHEIMIKVINSETDEVVREIPPEKILDLIANLMQLAGLVVDERG